MTNGLNVMSVARPSKQYRVYIKEVASVPHAIIEFLKNAAAHVVVNYPGCININLMMFVGSVKKISHAFAVNVKVIISEK